MPELVTAGDGVGVGVGGGLIVNVTVLVPVPLALVAVRITLLNVPAVVGVPEINPVLEGPLRPGGLLVAPQPPEGMAWFAVIWYENATPTVPVALPLITFGALAASALPAAASMRALPIAKAVPRHRL